jgi:hypothetical protein
MSKMIWFKTNCENKSQPNLTKQAKQNVECNRHKDYPHDR